MDPSPFLRIAIGNLAVKLPDEQNQPAHLDCKFKLKGFPTQVSTIQPFVQQLILDKRIHASFSLNKADLEKSGKTCCLRIEICAPKDKGIGCGYLNGGKLLGSVLVPLDSKVLEMNGRRGVVIQNGWVLVGAALLHLNVKAEHDPRFVFQFGGEPECSPQVFQVKGNVKQPVFTCIFSFRNSGDRNFLSRLVYLF